MSKVNFQIDKLLNSEEDIDELSAMAISDPKDKNVNELIIKGYSLKLELEKEEVNKLKQANGLRQHFAYFSMVFVSVSMMIIFLLVISGWVSDQVLIALLTTFSAQVIGVIGFVLSYLFPKQKSSE